MPLLVYFSLYWGTLWHFFSDFIHLRSASNYTVQEKFHFSGQSCPPKLFLRGARQRWRYKAFSVHWDGVTVNCCCRSPIKCSCDQCDPYPCPWRHVSRMCMTSLKVEVARGFTYENIFQYKHLRKRRVSNPRPWACLKRQWDKML